MPGMAPTEIKALARIIGELDYYQLLHLHRDAVAGEVKHAYHATSRAFHPDANRHLEPELREAVAVIAKRVSEAYSVLRNPRRRQAYDRRLESSSELRMQLAEPHPRGASSTGSRNRTCSATTTDPRYAICRRRSRSSRTTACSNSSSPTPRPSSAECGLSRGLLAEKPG
jgi:curved DNA-binding protein CbpA